MAVGITIFLWNFLNKSFLEQKGLKKRYFAGLLLIYIIMTMLERGRNSVNACVHRQESRFPWYPAATWERAQQKPVNDASKTLTLNHPIQRRGSPERVKVGFRNSRDAEELLPGDQKTAAAPRSPHMRSTADAHAPVHRTPHTRSPRGNESTLIFYSSTTATITSQVVDWIMFPTGKSSFNQTGQCWFHWRCYRCKLIWLPVALLQVVGWLAVKTL